MTDEHNLVRIYRLHEDLTKPAVRNAVGIEFEESNFSHNAPNVPIERSIVFVPYQGKLKQFDKCNEHSCICNYRADKIKEFTSEGKSLPAVMFQCPRGCEYYLMHLVWIEERKEWIGIEKESCMESSSCGMDDRYSAPKSLNDMHGKKILEAYKIPEGKMSQYGVLHTCPSELEEMASLNKMNEK